MDTHPTHGTTEGDMSSENPPETTEFIESVETSRNKGKSPVRDDHANRMDIDDETAGDQDEEVVDGDDDDDDEGEEEEYDSELPKRTRQDRDAARKDRSLAELLLMMDEYKPVIPDAVTDYYLARSGFECDDVRVKRLLALAAQKFVSDIAVDALQYCKIRGQGPQPKDRKGGGQKDKRTVLTMDDLSAALADHGVNVKKPEYFL